MKKFVLALAVFACVALEANAGVFAAGRRNVVVVAPQFVPQAVVVSRGFFGSRVVVRGHGGRAVIRGRGGRGGRGRR